MTTYNYWCPNSDCPNPDKKRDFRITTTGDGKRHTCPYCNTELKRMGRVCDNYGKFSSLSTIEQKKILKKRADEHASSKGEKEKREFKNRKIFGID